MPVFAVTKLSKPYNKLSQKSNILPLFQSGKYPSKLRHAKVIPLYKGDDETDPSNYRPISLLSVFNQIFSNCNVFFEDPNYSIYISFSFVCFTFWMHFIQCGPITNGSRSMALPYTRPMYVYRVMHLVQGTDMHQSECYYTSFRI